MMVLVLFAVIGFGVGCWLEMSRSGYATMALTSIGFSVGQFVEFSLAQTRSAIRLLPLEVGLVLVVFMFLGALARLAIAPRSNVPGANETRA
jgi:hypothetical protein